ncbi:hypothetical protein QFZ79_003385 [Arthrobacter sp. V4I6]|nr:hypothetical protein [Arthrobacter sp. V1I7]MDQ0855274.1 hypothetical protein [Arthrobacter sp. V4I6]
MAENRQDTLSEMSVAEPRVAKVVRNALPRRC